jgi:hypothetical protein
MSTPVMPRKSLVSHDEPAFGHEHAAGPRQLRVGDAAICRDARIVGRRDALNRAHMLQNSLEW